MENKRPKQAHQKGFHATSKGYTPTTVVDAVFEYMGRAAKRYLVHFWSDLAIDVRILDGHVKAMLDEMSTGQTSSTRDLVWICRDMGTHLYNIHEAAGIEGLDSANKTFGTNNCRCAILLICRPEPSDPTGFAFEWHFSILGVPKKTK